MMTFQTVSERFTGCSVSCVAANSSANRWFSFRSRSFSDCRSMLKGYILLSRLNRSPEVSIHSVRRAGSFVKRVANSLALPGAACSARLQQTSMPEQVQSLYKPAGLFAPVCTSTGGPKSIGSYGAVQHVERFGKSLYKTAGLFAPVCISGVPLPHGWFVVMLQNCFDRFQLLGGEG